MHEFHLPPHLDGLLVSNPVNITYLTSFRGVNPSETEGYLLITKSEWYFITFMLYKTEALQLQKENPSITPLFLTGSHISSILKPLVTKHEMRTLGIEEYSLTVSQYDQIKNQLPITRLIKGHEWIETDRIKKSTTEITSLKKACALTDECYSFIVNQLSPGQTEVEIAWKIEKYFREHGGDVSFASIVAFNEHSAMPHYQPDTSSKLQATSLVLLDFGAKVDGYHADMTRIVFYGKPKPEWVKAYETVKKAHTEAINYVQSTQNPSGATADAIAKKVITDAGYPEYPHGLGHGVGLEIHEAPRLSTNRDQILEPGMVFSIEPGLYLPGQFGMRIEDLVIKTKKGIEMLSHASYLTNSK